MLNILTIDLEDYYQVSAFEGIVKREDWNKFESRLECSTYRLLEILEESGIARSAKGTANEPTPVAKNVPPQTSNPQPETSDSSPAGSDSSPCTLHPVPYASGPSPRALHLAPCTPDVSSGVKATFFCLGWNAERYPHLIKEIHRQGHEIACHGYDHRLIYTMAPNEFREDVRKSKKILEDLIGERVVGYRAPSYSITRKSLWAFEILAQEGFQYDSSIFPIHHDRYGISGAPRFPFLVDLNGGSDPKFVSFPSLLAPNALHRGSGASILHPPTSNGQSALRHGSDPCTLHPAPSSLLMEFPISTVRLLGQNFPVSGGGYFRLLPYVIIRRALSRINKKDKRSFIFYLHPWELDDKQPKIECRGLISQFRHHVNLNQTESKLRRLLKHFVFSSVRDILNRNGALTC
jgi:polysaccharide deacetylase family protein (PEP-CTERM system associated)